MTYQNKYTTLTLSIKPGHTSMEVGGSIDYGRSTDLGSLVCIYTLSLAS